MMKLFPQLFAFMFVAVVVGSGSVVFAGTFDELRPDQQEQLLDNQTVALDPTPVQGSEWPRFKVLRLMHGTPKEVTALVWDVEAQKVYLPGMKQVHLEKQVNPSTVQVNYSLELPFPFEPENYTLENHLSVSPAIGGYQVSMNLVHADSVKHVDAIAYAESFRDGTLYIYDSYVIPKYPYNIITGQHALMALKVALDNMATMLDDEKASKQDVLARQLKALDQALAQ